MLFLGALVLVTLRTCQTESVSTTIEFRVGQAGKDVRQLRVDLFTEQDEAVGYFERFTPRGSPDLVGSWTLRADSGLYRMRVELSTVDDRVVVNRHLEVRDGRIVTVALAHELEDR